MLKQTIEYLDYNDNKAVDTLYFHISKSELMDQLQLRDQLIALQDRMTKNPDDEMSTLDIMEMIGIVKRLIRISYGKRSEDGTRFVKNEENWIDFESSAAYDAFLFSMFEKPEKALEFLTGIVPKDLQQQVMQESAVQEAVKAVGATPEPVIVKDDISDEDPQVVIQRLKEQLSQATKN